MKVYSIDDWVSRTPLTSIVRGFPIGDSSRKGRNLSGIPSTRRSYISRHFASTRAKASSGTFALSRPLVMTLFRKLAQRSSRSRKPSLPPWSWRPRDKSSRQYSLSMRGSPSSLTRAKLALIFSRRSRVSREGIDRRERPRARSRNDDDRHVGEPAFVVGLVPGAQGEVVRARRQIHLERLDRPRRLPQRLPHHRCRGCEGDEVGDRRHRVPHVVARRGPAPSVISGGRPAQSHRTVDEARLEDLDLSDLGGIEAPR